MATDLGFWQTIVETAQGRGQFRLIIQPLMAILIGVRLGIVDARSEEMPFLKRLILSRGHRRELATAAAKSVLIPFVLAVVIDAFLQFITHDRVRPLAALVMGAVLIWLPFSFARSIANRIYHSTHHGHGHPASA